MIAASELLRNQSRSPLKMSDFFAVNKAALKASASVMGQTFSIGAARYTGVISELSAKDTLAIGGFDASVVAQIVVAKVGFTAPAIGEKVQYNSVTRRVVAIDEDPICYTLHLEAVTK